MKKSIFLIPILAVMSLFTASTALADSFWKHNGSLMRLTADGNYRMMTYEKPTARLRSAGVNKGTLLFYGTNNHNYYSGTARVFSKYCYQPYEYYVEGPVVDGTTIVMQGKRDSLTKCTPNGKIRKDTLVFTYVRSD